MKEHTHAHATPNLGACRQANAIHASTEDPSPSRKAGAQGSLAWGVGVR